MQLLSALPSLHPQQKPRFPGRPTCPFPPLFRAPSAQPGLPAPGTCPASSSAWAPSLGPTLTEGTGPRGPGPISSLHLPVRGTGSTHSHGHMLIHGLTALHPHPQRLAHVHSGTGETLPGLSTLVVLAPSLQGGSGEDGLPGAWGWGGQGAADNTAHSQAWPLCRAPSEPAAVPWVRAEDERADPGPFGLGPWGQGQRESLQQPTSAGTWATSTKQSPDSQGHCSSSESTQKPGGWGGAVQGQPPRGARGQQGREPRRGVSPGPAGPEEACHPPRPHCTCPLPFPGAGQSPGPSLNAD